MWASPKLWKQLHFSFIYFNVWHIRPEGKGYKAKLLCRAASIHVRWKCSLQPTLMFGLSLQRNARTSQFGCNILQLVHTASKPACLGCLREENELLVSVSSHRRGQIGKYQQVL